MQPPKLTLSVIIPTLGRQLSLSRCLKALAEQSNLPDEVILVWDGAQEAKHNSQNLALPIKNFYLNPHQGQSCAKNLGARKAKGDLVLFLDDDSLPQADLIEKIKNFYYKQKDWRKTVLAGNILQDNNALKDQKSFKKTFNTLKIEKLKDAMLNLPLLPLELFLKKQYGGTIFPWGRCIIQYNTKQDSKLMIKKTDWGGAGCLSIPRKIFLRSGGFDEALLPGCHFEEPDLCLRLKMLKAKIFFHPLLIVYHPKKDTQSKNYLHLRANEAYFGLKNCAFESPLHFILFFIYHGWQILLYSILSLWQKKYFLRIEGKIKGFRYYWAQKN